MKTTVTGIKIYDSSMEFFTLYCEEHEGVPQDGVVYICRTDDKPRRWSVDIAMSRCVCECFREDDAIKIAEMLRAES